MADFEEKLNAILSSPESMQQVAQLAQMLSAQNAAEVPTDEEAASATLTAVRAAGRRRCDTGSLFAAGRAGYEYHRPFSSVAAGDEPQQ